MFFLCKFVSILSFFLFFLLTYIYVKVQVFTLKISIIEEASRMEKAENIQENESANTYQDSKIKKALNEIEYINKQIELFNKITNNQMK